MIDMAVTGYVRVYKKLRFVAQNRQKLEKFLLSDMMSID